MIIDSQSVKTNFDGEDRGFHGGKRIKGQSRQVAVDTEGNLLCVHVHAANKADTVEGCVLMKRAKPKLPRPKAVCADAGYRGTFEALMQEEFELPGLLVGIRIVHAVKIHQRESRESGFASLAAVVI